MAFWTSSSISKALLIAGGVLIATSGCSPGMFGSGKDDQTAQLKPYREVNTACSKVDLASPELKPGQFRGLLKCFNSNGALEEIQKLVDKLSDRELAPVLQVLNKYILKDASVLFQVEETYNSLRADGKLDSSLRQLSLLLDLFLENQEVVASLSSIISANADADFFKTLPIVAEKITPETVEDAFDFTLSLAKSKAFTSLQKKLRGDSPSGRGLGDVVRGFQRYMIETRGPGYFPFDRELLQATRDGRIFRALDDINVQSLKYLFRSSPLSISRLDPAQRVKELVPYVTAVFRTVLVSPRDASGAIIQDSPLFQNLMNLGYALHRPIPCFRGTQAISDGIKQLFRELSLRDTAEASSYIKRDNLLPSVILNSICEFPKEYGDYYHAIEELADTQAMRPTTDAIKAFTANGLMDFLGNTFGGLGGNGAPPSSMRHLVPLFAELNDRNAYEDLWLMVSLPRDEDRPGISKFLDFVLQARPELGNRGLYDVWSLIPTKASYSDLYGFADSFKKPIESDKPTLVPAVEALRSVFYHNDAHPAIRVLQNILRNETESEELFRSVYAISRLPEFKDAVRLLSEMSKDKRMRDLLGSVLHLFHRFAESGSVPVHGMKEPPFVLKTRHDWSFDDLVIPQIGPEPSRANAACRELDLNIKMTDFSSGRFAGQLENLKSCMNSQNTQQDIVDTLSFLQEQKTESGDVYLYHLIDQLVDSNIRGPELAELNRIWMSALDDGRLFRVLDGFTFWASRSVQPAGGAANSPSAPVLKTLIDGAHALLGQADEQVRRLESVAGRLLNRGDFFRILKYAERFGTANPEPASPVDQDGFDYQRIKSAVRQVECNANDGYQRVRANQLVSDYRNAVDNWSLQPGSGEPPRWRSLGDFAKEANPVLDKLKDSSQGEVLNGLLNVVRYFTLEPGESVNQLRHYPPQYFKQWLQTRSNDYISSRTGDYRLIPYFYPGENAPRVRLVNTLDAFELLLINSDFSFGGPGNYALTFAAFLAEAWGDEPREAWPDLIKSLYRDRKPLKISEALAEIQSTQDFAETFIGFPDVPNCPNLRYPDGYPAIPLVSGHFLPLVPMDVKVRLFNLHYIMPILLENLPESQTPARGGLKVLRDLLLELHASTPARYRNEYSGWKNNLMIGVSLAKLGIFRNIGRQLRLQGGTANPSASDKPLDDFFLGLVRGATECGSPGCKDQAKSSYLLKPVLEQVASDANREFLWNKIMEEVFKTLDNPNEGKYLKQLAFYAVADSASLNVAGPVLANVSQALANYGEYLRAHPERILDPLKSKRTSFLVRAYYEDNDAKAKAELSDFLNAALAPPAEIPAWWGFQRTQGPLVDALAILKAYDTNPELKSSWDLLKGRIEAITALEEYKKLELDKIAADIRHFFETEPGSSEAQTALQIRQFLADGIAKGDFHQFLLLAQRDPERFNRMFTMVSRHITNGELKEFLGLARRSLESR